MRLQATGSNQQIFTDQVMYIPREKEPDPSRQRYQFCHYLIVAENYTPSYLKQLQGDDGEEVRIFFTLTLRQRVNVYIYGGNSRQTATKSIVQNNTQPELMVEYSVPYSQGILVTVFADPQNYIENANAGTLLSFDYRLGAYSPDSGKNWFQNLTTSEFWEFEEPNGTRDIFIVIFVPLCLCFSCIMIFALCINACRKNTYRSHMENQPNSDELE